MAVPKHRLTRFERMLFVLTGVSKPGNAPVQARCVHVRQQEIFSYATLYRTFVLTFHWGTGCLMRVFTVQKMTVSAL